MVIESYKVYFDGEKFVADDEKNEVQAPEKGVPVFWVDKYTKALELAEDYNKHLKLLETDMVDEKDFVVRKCKDCGTFFMLTKSEYDWLKEKGFAVPRRCRTCRRTRRNNGKDAADKAPTSDK